MNATSPEPDGTQSRVVRRGDVRVAHSVVSWLPLTESFVYNQLRFTPVPSIVIANKLDPSGYEWNPVYTFASRRERLVQRILHAAEVRVVSPTFEAALTGCRATLLHSHFGDRGWFDRPLARRLGLRHVVTFYGYDLSRLPQSQTRWRRRYKSLFEEADLFLCEGPFMAKTLVELGCDAGRIRVQPLGIDPTEFCFSPRTPSADGTVRILIAGRFAEKKGIPLALEAAANVMEMHGQLRVTVIGDSSVGQAKEKAEKERIQEVVARRRLAPFVRFLGFQPHARLIDEAYAHQIFLSPSRRAVDGDSEGGAPVTLIEMAATGMPIVSTDHCDIPEVVVDGKTGLLAREADVSDLTRCLSVMTSSPERWAEFGAAGRRHVERNFDARALCLKLGQVYKHLAEGRSS